MSDTYEIQCDNGMLTAGRGYPRHLIVKPSGAVIQFEGAPVPGACVVTEERYEKNGKWSKTRYTLRLRADHGFLTLARAQGAEYILPHASAEAAADHFARAATSPHAQPQHKVAPSAQGLLDWAKAHAPRLYAHWMEIARETAALTAPASDLSAASADLDDASADRLDPFAHRERGLRLAASIQPPAVEPPPPPSTPAPPLPPAPLSHAERSARLSMCRGTIQRAQAAHQKQDVAALRAEAQKILDLLTGL